LKKGPKEEGRGRVPTNAHATGNLGHVGGGGESEQRRRRRRRRRKNNRWTNKRKHTRTHTHTHTHTGTHTHTNVCAEPKRAHRLQRSKLRTQTPTEHFSTTLLRSAMRNTGRAKLATKPMIQLTTLMWQQGRIGHRRSKRATRFCKQHKWLVPQSENVFSNSDNKSEVAEKTHMKARGIASPTRSGPVQESWSPILHHHKRADANRTD